MTRVHDMGGRFGDGAIDVSQHGVFEEEWHGRTLALTLATGFLGQWNIDASRHMREKLSPQDYARFSYYEKWLAGLADLLVDRGVLTLAELAGGETKVSPLAGRKVAAERVADVLYSGGPSERTSDVPARFGAGMRVRTRRPARNVLVDGGHTRLPAYAAGCSGVVLRCHGAHVLPDSNGHYLGEAPEPLYAVAFAARDLWGEAEAEGDQVILDLWESYLEVI